MKGKAEGRELAISSDLATNSNAFSLAKRIANSKSVGTDSKNYWAAASNEVQPTIGRPQGANPTFVVFLSRRVVLLSNVGAAD